MIDDVSSDRSRKSGWIFVFSRFRLVLAFSTPAGDFLFLQIPVPRQFDTKGEGAGDNGILTVEIAEREFSQENNIIDVAVAGYLKKEYTEK